MQSFFKSLRLSSLNPEVKARLKALSQDQYTIKVRVASGVFSTKFFNLGNIENSAAGNRSETSLRPVFLII